MPIKLLFGCVLLLVNKPMHDIRMAIFTYEFTDSSIQFTVSLDKEDLLNSYNFNNQFDF